MSDAIGFPRRRQWAEGEWLACWPGHVASNAQNSAPPTVDYNTAHGRFGVHRVPALLGTLDDASRPSSGCAASREHKKGR